MAILIGLTSIVVIWALGIGIINLIKWLLLNKYYKAFWALYTGVIVFIILNMIAVREMFT